MIHAVYTPRLNNNDDEVRLTEILIRPGDQVKVGQALAQVETDKANVTVESAHAGFVLRVLPPADSMVRVGSVLLWIGDAADEAIPQEQAARAAPAVGKSAEPTAKARALLAQHGLNAADVPARGERLTTEDIEAYLKQRPAQASPPAATPSDTPKTQGLAAGRLVDLSMEERGMLRSVLWHRDEAVPAYLEIELETTPWADYAKAYAAERRLLGDPLLPLMAHKLVTIARDYPKANSTIVDGRRHAYEHVNLGFTIQVQDSLYLVVVPEAETKEPQAFVEALNRLHRRAIARKLGPVDLQGATVGFTSMARWQVSRHLPILPPHVSLMVAHTALGDKRTVLGATYDHRVLSGGDTVAILQRLAQAPA